MFFRFCMLIFLMKTQCQDQSTNLPQDVVMFVELGYISYADVWLWHMGHRRSTPEDRKTHWTQFGDQRCCTGCTNNQQPQMSPFYLSPWMMFSSISVSFPNFPIATIVIFHSATCNIQKSLKGNDLQTNNPHLRCRNQESPQPGVRTVPRHLALWRRQQGQARPTTLHLAEWQPELLQNGMHAAECIYKYYHMLSSYATYPYDCYDIRLMIQKNVTIVKKRWNSAWKHTHNLHYKVLSVFL